MEETEVTVIVLLTLKEDGKIVGGSHSLTSKKLAVGIGDLPKEIVQNMAISAVLGAGGQFTG
jgi:hypothetical protein